MDYMPVGGLAVVVGNDYIGLKGSVLHRLDDQTYIAVYCGVIMRWGRDADFLVKPLPPGSKHTITVTN